MENLIVKEVQYHNIIMMACQRDNVIYVSVRSICDGLGISYNGQIERINRDDILPEGVRKIRIPTQSGEQEVNMMDISYLPFFLVGIKSKMVREELREKISEFKLKAKDVLAEAFIPQTLESTLPLEIQFMQKTLESLTNMHLELQGVKGNISQLQNKTAEVEERFDDVKTVFTQKDENWRQYITDSVNLIVKKSGRSFAEVRNETYDRLRSTTSCNLKTRLEHMKERMYQQGIPHSKVNNINNMDVIENDNKLKTALTYIVKEMVVAYA